MEDLLSRLRRMGGLFLIGILVIACVAFGIDYISQGARQSGLREQIDQVSQTVAKPLPSAEKLQQEYDDVKLALSPLTAKEALDIIIDIARDSGIGVDDTSKNKFRIPPQEPMGEKKIGEHNYRLLSFNNIVAQGDYDSVMAFISSLESGKLLETLVLKSVVVRSTDPKIMEDKEAGVAEFKAVSEAVVAMMADNGITRIPDPADYAVGIAQNQMGFVLGTINKGFPDFTTTAKSKGYIGIDTPNPGYLLYEHDMIDPEDTTVYTTVSYLLMAQTRHFYTCETDGTVRQWSIPNVAGATEYLSSGEAKAEYTVTLGIDIYTELGGDDL
ncbi:hypothetical protein ACFLV3_00685 [Chloroflexota bacterium]